MEHRPPPHHGRVLLDEEADRHHLHAVRLQRDDLALGRDGWTGRAQAVHPRDRVPPDVCVEHAHALALAHQRSREVRRQRGLAHAALAGADAEHVGDLRERSVGQAATAQLLLQGGLLRVVENVEVDVHVGHALERRDGPGYRGLEVALDRAAGSRQRDRHVDHAVAAELDRADHVELDDRAMQLGIDDDLERLEDLVPVAHPPIVANVRRGAAECEVTGSLTAGRKRPADGGGRPRVEGGEGATTAGGI